MSSYSQRSSKGSVIVVDHVTCDPINILFFKYFMEILDLINNFPGGNEKLPDSMCRFLIRTEVAGGAPWRSFVHTFTFSKLCWLSFITEYILSPSSCISYSYASYNGYNYGYEHEHVPTLLLTENSHSLISVILSA